MGHEEGTSLVELMVGLVLMTVFMAMFTGAVVMMNNAMNKSQAVNQTASQLNVAFQSLDETVRYAAAISTPGLGAPSGNWYVEMRATTTGAEVCTQLTVDIASQQLKRRTWTVVNAVAVNVNAWVPIASGVSAGAVTDPTTQPFYLVTARANTVYQQLTVNLIALSGSGSSFTNSASSFTFTAVNSVVPVPTGPICKLSSGWRP